MYIRNCNVYNCVHIYWMNWITVGTFHTEIWFWPKKIDFNFNLRISLFGISYPWKSLLILFYQKTNFWPVVFCYSIFYKLKDPISHSNFAPKYSYLRIKILNSWRKKKYSVFQKKTSILQIVYYPKYIIIDIRYAWDLTFKCITFEKIRTIWGVKVFIFWKPCIYI